MTEKQKIVTFGCRLNAFESQVMRDTMGAAGLEDVILFNTCAVTAEAERQARQAIRRARRERPEARIIVTGCAAQIDPKRFAAMDEVDLVLGNAEKMQPDTFTNLTSEPVRVNDIMEVKETAGHLITGLEDRARAFVQVQNGCNHRCTFCIIPYGRGNSRSVPMGAVVDQVRKLVTAGYKEVVLTGIDITSYGPDLPGQPSLGQLVRRLLKQVPELPRLRLSSIDSIEIDDHLIRAIAEEDRLMPHLHLSLQSGSDMILKRMKRRHSRADAIEFCRKARELRPDIAFGADIIAGFPTETNEMFEGSLRLIEECGLTWLHVFPYSARPGTPAARMPQHPKSLCKERAALLRQAGSAAETAFFNAAIGSQATIVVEQDARGRTEQFAPVTLNKSAPEGSLLQVAITGARDNALEGHSIGACAT
jgi:threonylcarbamoyladenosine tRNA methylthiotransferase MtaB